MEMGFRVRTKASFAKDGVTTFDGSKVLGDEDNNMPMVIYDTEEVGINSVETDKRELHQEREGEQIDRALLKNVLDIFVEMLLATKRFVQSMLFSNSLVLRNLVLPYCAFIH
ncbi:hypothetical protein RDI58_001376 [Solanum bulbocastanum]|uniref:Uncharacterized protein n=1 Tax=Solanum bulbocastanum TaxID=147425 RepID=A0AAN8UDY0_SOLBU